jgi:hypothetical protein
MLKITNYMSAKTRALKDSYTTQRVQTHAGYAESTLKK